jgi:hypothetical protein
MIRQTGKNLPSRAFRFRFRTCQTFQRFILTLAFALFLAFELNRFAVIAQAVS